MSKKECRKIIYSWLKSLDQSLVSGNISLPEQYVSTSCRDELSDEKAKLERILKLQEERKIKSIKRETTILGFNEQGIGDDLVSSVKINKNHTYLMQDEICEEKSEDLVIFNFVKSNKEWLITSFYADCSVNDFENNRIITINEAMTNEAKTSAVYDYEAAVAYANKFWNSPNPQYLYFSKDDCTNYISQCLHAGGWKMEFSESPDNGWWYRHSSNKTNDTWAYAWSLAHSFYWYIKEKRKIGPKVTQVKSPYDLELGDVISYKWKPGEKWSHTTIVTSFDSQGAPLINAHTWNSYHRHWSYRDSDAWTPQIEYAFWHIER